MSPTCSFVNPYAVGSPRTSTPQSKTYSRTVVTRGALWASRLTRLVATMRYAHHSSFGRLLHPGMNWKTETPLKSTSVPRSKMAHYGFRHGLLSVDVQPTNNPLAVSSCASTYICAFSMRLFLWAPILSWVFLHDGSQRRRGTLRGFHSNGQHLARIDCDSHSADPR